MNKTEELALALNQEILNSSELKAYFHSLKVLEKHPDIFQLEKELKKMQKKILSERTNPDRDTSDLMQEYLEKKDAFENHPLVANYLIDKENVQSLCNFIQEVIEGQLD